MIEQIAGLLKSGKVVIMPTDTIYGIVGSALNPQTVEEIYKLRKRKKGKPFIILIADIKDLGLFKIKLTKKQKNYLEKIWPNPVSVILPVKDEEYKYLHRGTNSIAFRIPKDKKLLKILKKAGPIVAPSANFEGEKPAENIDEAKKYFGTKVAFYLDGGQLKSLPSTLVKIEKTAVKILRQGKFVTNL